jgi:hypothetical protein
MKDFMTVILETEGEIREDNESDAPLRTYNKKENKENQLSKLGKYW